MRFHFRKNLYHTFLFFRKCIYKAASFCCTWLPARRHLERRKTEGTGSWINPYLKYSRNVIEEVLKQRGIDYRSFRPTLIDTNQPDQIFGEADDVDQVLPQLERGLNFLEICTDRPDYFANWKDYMEREYGLMIRVVPKSHGISLYGNVILDFERPELRQEGFAEKYISRMSGEVIYLPFQKREWKAEYRDQLPENDSELDGDFLDIKVPIGYNMLTVRVKRS